MFFRPSWGGSLVMTWKADVCKANAKPADGQAAPWGKGG
jgi:hypothetical protein